jgi:hypothetical protein
MIIFYNILKVEYLKKYKIFRKSEKKRAISSYSEYFKIGVSR